ATASELPAPVAQMAPPQWMPQAQPSTSRTPVMVAAVAVIALMASGVGLWAWQQSANQSQTAAVANPSQTATPSTAGSPLASPTVARALTAQLAGDVNTRGTFTYSVEFADISVGSSVYVNQPSDGTHDVVSWREVIT